MRNAFFIFLFCLITASAYGQNGGKAEPNRLTLAAGQSRIGVSGTLANGQEMEYLFSARAGQTITIRNTTSSLFDFRVFRPESDFETEFESSPVLTFEIPETGDYYFFVRKKQVASPRRARFTMSITIK